MTPRATYRFQFHERFGFKDAEALVPYLDRLGISHVYASPITVAAKGSTHGYDVIDPTRISPDLGGEDAFRSLVATLRARGMGVIIDIVPNHMGVAGGGNAWWNDVLANGQASRYARFFDIDWSHRLVLPILGAPLAEVLADGQITVERRDGRAFIVAYGEHRLPVRDEDQDAAEAMPLADLLDRQHYRLASWRMANDELNWRRFFTISELAGLRIEDPAVFEETHALYFRLYEEGLIDGVRIDHVDGLTDPAGYCRLLRERLDALPRPAEAPKGPAYIVVEKILAADEPMPTDWGVDGTSGYDFMEEVAALLHAPEAAEPLGTLWAEISGNNADFAPEELRARQDMLAWQFSGQLDGCVAAFMKLADTASDASAYSPAMWRRAIERLLWVFPVYRTYGPDAPVTDEGIRAEARGRVERFIPPGETAVVEQVLEWLSGKGPGDAACKAEAVRRFQQLSAPIAAKSVEDTAFYRYGRLLSRNDVGFDAGRMALDIDTFHRRMQGRAEQFPHAMLTTATHDHKRGEDIRARLSVLSAVPQLWRDQVQQWRELTAQAAEGIDPADWYMLIQTLFGAWPDDDDLVTFAERVQGWQEKALREAKLRSSWEAPDEAYEACAQQLVKTLLTESGGAEFRRSMADFVTRLAPAADAVALAQVALRCTVPGVPDCYQGSEDRDLSLVDPDNRRPVDYPRLQRLLETGGSTKQALIADLLDLRRERAFEGYRPLPVSGARQDRIVAFARTLGTGRFICAVAIRHAEALIDGGQPDWWEDTAVTLDGESLSAATLFADGPVWYRMED
ncbi:malto-oligosyltrehalose synthase [Sphingomonas sp.]|uniref:malto-oligosyltrehalose synthase n=1 Tax=Sphingomonas sp. TaxID=28214 RepID=UPI0035B4C471